MIKTWQTSDYEILVVGLDGDETLQNVDVVVTMPDGGHYAAVFMRPDEISELMARYATTGECAGGSYFWSTDTIFVKRITEATIRDTIKHLVENGEFESAFSEPSYDIELLGSDG